MNFTSYEESIFYQEQIKKYSPKYFVTFGPRPRFDHLEGCIVGLYKKKNNVGNFSTRNPFGKGKKYNGYIYYFDSSKLPNCKKNN